MWFRTSRGTVGRMIKRTLLGAALAAMALAGCGTDEPAQRGFGGPRGPTKVVASELKPERMIDSIEALGTARANESIEITPRVASLITRIAFDEGQFVNEGDLLVELENSEIRANLAIAEASLSESRSSYDRSRSLLDTRVISEAELEQLAAAMQVDEATVEAAKARLDNTYIRAPFSGRVGLRRVSPGGFVDTNTVITTLDDTETIKLDFTIPETFLATVSENMGIVADSLVYPDRQFAGRVDSIDTRLDPVSRSVQVRAIMDNADGLLKPGMFMTVDLQRDRGDALVAPEESIVPEGEQHYVYLIEEGVARKQRVEIGRRIPGAVVLLSGASPGDIVVTEGTQKVRDGAPVEIINMPGAEMSAADVEQPPAGGRER